MHFEVSETVPRSRTFHTHTNALAASQIFGIFSNVESLKFAACGARRMADSAALLVDDILPHKPMRQWVLSVPFPLRFLFARQPAVMGKVLGIVYRVIATHLIQKAGYTKTTAQAGAVTLIQCFGGALNANIHFHMIFLDGVYIDGAAESRARFRWVKAPTSEELT